MPILRVALDVPLPKVFDYRSDDASRSDIGARALVPFGKKLAVGIVVDFTEQSEIAEERLRRVERVLRDVPPLPAAWLDLAKFASDYYHKPLGEVMLNALPPRLRTAKPPPAPLRSVALNEAGRSELAREPGRAKRRRLLLERLAQGPLDEDHLAALPK